MGLGISVVSKKPKQKFLGIFSRESDWKHVIELAIRKVASRYSVEFLVPPARQGQTNELPAHFCEEWVSIETNGAEIVLSARTSTCGPGYHALIVEAIDEVNQSSDLAFQERGEYIDETDYFANRNFAELQVAHATWLKSLGKLIAESEQKEETYLQVSLSVSAIVPGYPEGTIATPKGPLTIDYFQKLAVADGAALLDHAKSWFPWWDRQPSALDFAKTADILMWVEVPWHIPANEHETRVMVAASTAGQAARTASKSVLSSEVELVEVDSFLNSRLPQGTKPKSTGIGYRRSNCIRRLGSDWSIEFPGYWYEVENENGWGFHFDQNEMWISTFTVELKEETTSPLDLPKAKDNERTVIEELKKDLNYRLSYVTDTVEDARNHYFLIATRNNGFLTASFYCGNEDWKAIIPDIARSVRG